MLVGHNEYSAVYTFTHRDPHASEMFVKLITATSSLLLTPEHYVYANTQLVPAMNVEAGDMLERADGSLERVVAVARELASGLYNPHTLHGDIVVVRNCHNTCL